MRRIKLGNAVTIAVTILLMGASPVNACDVYGSNSGAAYGFFHNVRGTKAAIDLEDANLVGIQTTIVHPLQIVSTITPDFIGWGTYRGYGTHVSGALSNCPDDYSDWNIYLDGVSFGTYFCRVGYGAVGDAVQDKQLKVTNHPSDTCTNIWRLYWQFELRACQEFNGYWGTSTAAGGEAANSSALTSEIQHIDVHYGQLQYQGINTNDWHSWGESERCVEPYYRIRKLANDDIWAEEE